MEAIPRAGRFLVHWLNKVDQHSLQSPFIFEFYQKVIKNSTSYASMEKVNMLREALLKDQTRIQVTDLGTGSQRSAKRRIADLARHSNQPKVSRLLFNLCQKYQPGVILELGTNLGLSTLSMAAAVPQAHLITIEGCAAISERALDNFKRSGNPDIELITGDISQELPGVLSKIDSICLLFIDANHRYQAVMEYFNRCLPKCHSQTIVVMDDIHWSRGMQQAWQEIQTLPRVKLTVDLFFAGVVFFREELHHSHYVLGL